MTRYPERAAEPLEIGASHLVIKEPAAEVAVNVLGAEGGTTAGGAVVVVVVVVGGRVVVVVVGATVVVATAASTRRSTTEIVGSGKDGTE